MTKELIALLDGKAGRVVRDNRGNPNAILQRASELAGLVADHVSGVKQQMTREGLKHPIIPRLAEAVAKRAAAGRKIIQSR